MRLLALTILAGLALATPGSAATFTSSVTVDQTYAGFAEVMLPKYAGAGTITSVTFVFSGLTDTYRDVPGGDDPRRKGQKGRTLGIGMRGPAL